MIARQFQNVKCLCIPWGIGASLMSRELSEHGRKKNDTVGTASHVWIIP